MEFNTTSFELYSAIKDNTSKTLLNNIYQEKTLTKFRILIQNTNEIQHLFSYLLNDNNLDQWEDILKFLIKNFMECKHNLYVFLKINAKFNDTNYTFLKVLLTMLFEVFKIEDPKIYFNTLRETSKFNELKVKSLLFQLVELVLNNFTICKVDLEVVYQKLSKYYHNKENLTLTKNMANCYIELFKVTKHNII